MEKKRGRLFLLQTVLGCFLLGIIISLCSDLQRAVAADLPDYSGFRQAVLTAYQNLDTTVAVDKYHLYQNAKTSKKISRIMEEVINETPEFFYAGREFSKDILKGTNQIVSIRLSYASSYKKNGKVNVSQIRKMRIRIERETKKALRLLKSNMTKVDKAMLLHDYLIQKVSYNNKDTLCTRLTQEGALVKKQANCQGYAVTYMALLKRAGIQAKCITSAKMNHMWNLVKIGSSWYHVDVTWDDAMTPAGKSVPNKVLHKNFLLSNRGIKKTGHYSFVAVNASNRRFDKKYWKTIKKAFIYRKKRFYYYKKSKLYARKHIA